MKTISREEVFVWPWVAVVVNVQPAIQLKDQLERMGCYPKGMHSLIDHEGHPGIAVIKFSEDWSGFHKAISFEKACEANRQSKKDWWAAKGPSSHLYGWVARVDDFISNDIVGEHLRKIGDLKTVAEIIKEEAGKGRRLFSTLVDVIEEKTTRSLEVEDKLKQTENSISLLKMEQEKINRSHNEEIKQIQSSSQACFQKISNENEKLKLQVEEEKCRANEAEGVQRALHARKLQLEKEKEALNLKIKELTAKAGLVEDLEALNQTLVVQEQRKNDELNDARKEVISSLKEVAESTTIGVKRMGEVDLTPFREALKKSRKSDVAKVDSEAAELCSIWQQHIQDPKWHPLKVIQIDGKLQEVINEEDEKLRTLKDSYGSEVYGAVIKAFLELNEYNPSGRYPIEELWNFPKGKRATLKEGIARLRGRSKLHKRNWRG